MLKVRLNGLEVLLSHAVTLEQFLSDRQLALDFVVVEYNGDIIKKEKLAAIVLKEQDEIEVLQFVGGGENNDQ